MRSRNADFILPVHRPINKMAIVPARTMLDSLIDEKGRTPKVEIRQSDGYFNATLMCQSSSKTWSHYIENKRTGLYLNRLSAIIGFPRKDLIIQQRRDFGKIKQCTWVHPRVMPHLHQWCQQKQIQRDGSGYVYLATSPLLNAVKIGCWTGSLANSKSRYTTPYGPHLEIERVLVSDCLAAESQMHDRFKVFNLGGELFEKAHAAEYSKSLQEL